MPDIRDRYTQGGGAQTPVNNKMGRAYYPGYMQLDPSHEMAMRQGSDVRLGGVPHWMDEAGKVFTYWNQLPDGMEEMYQNDPYYDGSWERQSNMSGGRGSDMVHPSPEVSMMNWAHNQPRSTIATAAGMMENKERR